MSNKLGFCDATKKMVSKHLLVVVQSKHSVVEAGKVFNKRRMKN